MPKVTIVLTSFNHEKYLAEAIDSALNQTFVDFELFLWDDASSDSSWEIINSYSDPRIKAFLNTATKRGIFGINKAISEIAAGEYIAIHHSDDVWELDKLEKQVAYLDAHSDIGAVFTWAQIIDENGVKDENEWFEEENKTRWQWLRQLFLEENHLNHPSVLIRRKCYQEVGRYRYGLAQTADAEMWSRLLIKFPIHVIQEKLTKHRLFSDKSNTSGLSAVVAIRLANEWNIVRENFLSITSFEDIVAIFPGLERFRRPNGFDIQFLLAMACFYECEQRNAWQLGFKWLYDQLNDKTRYKIIRDLYSFSYIDFIRITGEFDVFESRSLHELKETNAWLDEQRQSWMNVAAEREQSILSLQAYVQDLLTAKDWLDEQRQAWEKLADEREQSNLVLQARVQSLGNLATEHEQSIAMLTTQLQETTERLAAANAILDKIRNHWGMRFVNRFFKADFL